MLREAGYSVKNGKMTSPDGTPLSIEILLNASSGEQLAMAWQRTLEKIGIEVTLRPVDSAQYQQRLQTYDYDVMLQFYFSSLSPGAEQIGRWGTASRDAEGTYNFAGVADPDVDAAISNLQKVRTRDEFIAAVRAYDRVLLNGAYVVPLYYRNEQWVAHWNRLGHLPDVPVYGYQLQTWWAAE
jgi:peptide/nickel transport system substrate-binding protein